MKINSTPAIALSFICMSLYLFISKKEDHVITPVSSAKNNNAVIQVAILLDVSNSMDGLIEQAKAQLWNMVTVMGKATCGSAMPRIELALYEYGRSNNIAKEGYVKQLSDFTTDLDKLSKILFDIKTDGGEEYCGHVIYKSLTQLGWDSSASNYKVIFIAGNEDFLQGNITYTRSCAEAKKKGVIVNTIYCGDKMQGIREHWNLGAECGSGSFTNINQDAALEDIVTPYDSVLFTLNDQLNKTYIPFGMEGSKDFEQQDKVDKLNRGISRSVAAKRVAVKGKKELYKNSRWDLVDAISNDSSFISKVDVKTLPDSLRGKNRAGLLLTVKEKTSQRTKIQQQIATAGIQRDQYIAAEKSTAKPTVTEATLESEIEKIIKGQAKRFNIVIQ